MPCGSLLPITWLCCFLIFYWSQKEKSGPANMLVWILSSDPVTWGPEKMHTRVQLCLGHRLTYKDGPLKSQLSKQQCLPERPTRENFQIKGYSEEERQAPSSNNTWLFYELHLLYLLSTIQFWKKNNLDWKYV